MNGTVPTEVVHPSAPESTGIGAEQLAASKPTQRRSVANPANRVGATALAAPFRSSCVPPCGCRPDRPSRRTTGPDDPCMAARAYGIRIGDVRRLSPRTSDDHGRYHHLVACQISQESTTEVAVAHIGPQRPVQRTALFPMKYT